MCTWTGSSHWLIYSYRTLLEVYCMLEFGKELQLQLTSNTVLRNYLINIYHTQNLMH